MSAIAVATAARINAAVNTGSSTSAHTSLTRTSTVGYVGDSRAYQYTIASSSITPATISAATVRW